MKCVFAVGALPAPETPDLESQTMPRSRVDPARVHERLEGQDDRGGIAAGIGDELRRRESRRDAARACRRRLLVWTVTAVSHAFVREFVDGAVGRSFKRHAPLRSMTRMPRSSASGTHSRDCSWGVARKRTSTLREAKRSQENGSTTQ